MKNKKKIQIELWDNALIMDEIMEKNELNKNGKSKTD